MKGDASFFVTVVIGHLKLFKKKEGCTRLTAASDKVYQLLTHGRWFSPDTLASSTTKSGRHDIAEILLKVALNTKNQLKSNHKGHIQVLFFGLGGGGRRY